MLTPTLGKLQHFIEIVLAQLVSREQPQAYSLQTACCGLLMEVARLDSDGAERKRKAVAQAMGEAFGIPGAEIAPMIADAGRPENRLTSYFKPVARINKDYAPEQKVQFIERLWRVAMADGKIDMYEEQLVRKLAELLYVAHTDYILARHRVQNRAGS